MRNDLQTGSDVRATEMRLRNRRTGFILASIALVFFVGIIVKYTLH